MSKITINKILLERMSSGFPGWNIGAPGEIWQPGSVLETDTQLPMQVGILYAPTQNPTKDNNHKRETGVFQVSIFYPIGSGHGQGQEVAELVKERFKRGLDMSELNVRVLIDQHPYDSQPFEVQGLNLMPVTIPFIADVM